MTAKKETIGAACMTLIKAGLTNEAIVASIKTKFPNAKTTPSSVAWYRSKMKDAPKPKAVAPKTKAAQKAKKVSDLDRAKAFFNDHGDHFAYLYGRWQDEQEYEDFNEYITSMQVKLVAHDATLVKMTKRPFALTFKVGASTFKLSANSKTIGLTQI